MPCPVGERFFEALFGFAEGDYLSTRQRLFSRCTFEPQLKCAREVTAASGERVFKERALFQHPRLGGGGGAQFVSSGWHSTPSVAELRAATANLVQQFEQTHPGLLSDLREASRTSSVEECHAHTGSQSKDDHDQAKHAETSPQSSSSLSSFPLWLRCSHVTGESGDLHCRFPGAFFQVASQFNLLEFISADVTPEDGVTHYVYDRTQGPACALACMAGTVYRNYLLHPALFKTAAEDGGITEATSVEERRRGQRSNHQLNMLSDLTAYLTRRPNATAAGSPSATAPTPLSSDHFFSIRGGYFFPTEHMSGFEQRLTDIAAAEGVTVSAVEEALVSRLRIGVVEDATVTLPLHHDGPDKGPSPTSVHAVSQSYNSALSLPPRAQCTKEEWAGMVALSNAVLRGTYEATLLAGVQHTLRCLEQQATRREHLNATPLPPIFLTKVGGGVFRNDAAWIAAAVEDAVRRVAPLGVPLDIRLVHHNMVDPYYRDRFPSWAVP